MVRNQFYRVLVDFDHVPIGLIAIEQDDIAYLLSQFIDSSGAFALLTIGWHNRIRIEICMCLLLKRASRDLELSLSGFDLDSSHGHLLLVDIYHQSWLSLVLAFNDHHILTDIEVFDHKLDIQGQRVSIPFYVYGLEVHDPAIVIKV